VVQGGGAYSQGNTILGAYAGGIISVPASGGGDSVFANGFGVPGAQVEGPETPDTAVVADKSGNLYGATEQYYIPGGSNLEGVIYEVTP
jgi:hypothetical protein